MELIIPTKEIPANEFKAVHKYFIQSRNYEYLDKSMPSWSIIIEASKLAPHITEAQLLSIRNLTLKNKIILRNRAVRSSIHRYADLYANGKSILEVSEEADYPPGLLLKMIVAFRGESYRDAEQAKLAAEHDINSLDCETKTAKSAEEAERYFVDHLRGLGIKLRDQAKLTDEQRDSLIKLTPDALFDEPITINGYQVNWIDYKNYVGCPISFVRKSNRRQVDKYTAAFGPGAICFGKSVVSGYTIPGCYFLDVSSIMAKKDISSATI